MGTELLGDENNSKPNQPGHGTFSILDNTVCKQLKFSKTEDRVESAVVFDSYNNVVTELRTKVFVVAACETPYTYHGKAFYTPAILSL